MTDKDFSDNLHLLKENLRGNRQLVLEVASKKIIRELPYSFDFLDFCSINWQEHEISAEMFNRFLNSHITDIVRSLHFVARTNVNFFKCWYAQFSKAIADLKIRIDAGITDGAFFSTSIYSEASFAVLNYIREEGLDLINYKSSFINAVENNNTDMFDYFKDKVNYEDLPKLQIRSIDILERIFKERLPVKINVYLSLEYMKHDTMAYDIMYTMGLLHGLATWDIVTYVALSKSEHVSHLFEDIIEPHFLLFDEPTTNPNVWSLPSESTWSCLAEKWVFKMWDRE